MSKPGSLSRPKSFSHLPSTRTTTLERAESWSYGPKTSCPKTVSTAEEKKDIAEIKSDIAVIKRQTDEIIARLRKEHSHTSSQSDLDIQRLLEYMKSPSTVSESFASKDSNPSTVEVSTSPKTQEHFSLDSSNPNLRSSRDQIGIPHGKLDHPMNRTSSGSNLKPMRSEASLHKLVETIREIRYQDMLNTQKDDCSSESDSDLGPGSGGQKHHRTPSQRRMRQVMETCGLSSEDVDRLLRSYIVATEHPSHVDSTTQLGLTSTDNKVTPPTPPPPTQASSSSKLRNNEYLASVERRKLTPSELPKSVSRRTSKEQSSISRTVKKAGLAER